MDQLGVDPSSLLVAYDFTQDPVSNNQKLLPTSWSSGCYTGLVNGNLANFSNVSGSGFLNGFNSIDISGSIPSDNFSFLFCYEKLRTGSEILLSSATGSSFSQRSGLTLGVNDVNRLYLEYWNPIDGNFSMTYPGNISNKNIVFLNKSYNNFNLGVFDTTSSKLITESVSLVNGAYSHSNKFRIGNKFDSNSWSVGSGFSGFFDDFYCLNETLPQDYFSVFCSGFYSTLTTGEISGTVQSCQYVSTLSGSGINIGTGITGYETNITYITGYVPTGCFNSGYSYLVGTGITGYYEKYMGSPEDACGINTPIYIRTPLTGQIYASGVTLKCNGSGEIITPIYNNRELTGFLTGEVFVEVLSGICSGVTKYYPGYIAVDSGFISSLGFDSIYSFKTPENIISNESFLYTGFVDSNINLKPSYDSSVFDYIIPASKSGTLTNLFFNNGQLLFEDGWSSYQQGYNTLYNITGNIFLDGNIIRSNGYNDTNDSLIYDHFLFNSGISLLESIYMKTGYASGIAVTGFTGAYVPRANMYFLNGLKLLSGLDYSDQTSLNFKFNIPESSVLTRVSNSYISSGLVYLTGINNLIKLNTGKFLKNTSQVYLNGLRQYPNEDYIEYSSLNLLSGNYVEGYNSLLYTSSVSDNFWNM